MLFERLFVCACLVLSVSSSSRCLGRAAVCCTLDFSLTFMFSRPRVPEAIFPDANRQDSARAFSEKKKKKKKKKYFLPYMGMTAILFSGLEPHKQIIDNIIFLIIMHVFFTIYGLEGHFNQWRGTN